MYEDLDREFRQEICAMYISCIIVSGIILFGLEIFYIYRPNSFDSLSMFLAIVGLFIFAFNIATTIAMIGWGIKLLILKIIE